MIVRYFSFLIPVFAIIWPAHAFGESPLDGRWLSCATNGGEGDPEFETFLLDQFSSDGSVLTVTSMGIGVTEIIHPSGFFYRDFTPESLDGPYSEVAQYQFKVFDTTIVWTDMEDDSSQILGPRPLEIDDSMRTVDGIRQYFDMIKGMAYSNYSGSLYLLDRRSLEMAFFLERPQIGFSFEGATSCSIVDDSQAELERLREIHSMMRQVFDDELEALIAENGPQNNSL